MEREPRKLSGKPAAGEWNAAKQGSLIVSAPPARRGINWQYLIVLVGLAALLFGSLYFLQTEVYNGKEKVLGKKPPKKKS